MIFLGKKLRIITYYYVILQRNSEIKKYENDFSYRKWNGWLQIL